MGIREAFMAGFRAGMEKRAEVTELFGGYKLFIYDNGQMKIKMPRPYVWGDTAYAVSYDGGHKWELHIEYDSPLSYDNTFIDYAISQEEDYLDIVLAVEELDNLPSNKRFIDRT